MRGLYILAFDRICEVNPNKNGIRRFPKVFQKLCATFSITKKSAWDILFFFRDLGFIQIVPYQGIKIIKNPTGIEL